MTTGWSGQNGIYTNKKNISLKFTFEVLECCLFWKQRKQFCTSLHSEAHTQKYGNKKTDELVTLRKMCYFQMEQLDAGKSVFFAVVIYKSPALFNYHFKSRGG